jgi:hypothetical protein
MKQTAVEWLENEITGLDTGMSFHYFEDKIQQAKEMEKEQMINFANDLLARNNKNYIALPDLAEEYYNETFKNQLQG